MAQNRAKTNLVKKVEESKTQEPKRAAGKVPSPLQKVGLSIVNDKQVQKVEEAKTSEVEHKLLDDLYNGGECNICMCVMVEPVIFPCQHIFCAQCAVLFLAKKHECPLDRKAVPKNFELKVFKELQNKIRVLKPKEYSAMEKEIKKGQGMIANQVELEFEVGNRYQELKKFNMNAAGKKELKHQWSLYIKPLDPKIRAKQHLIIKEVKLYLHPTFRQPTRWIKGIKANQPIELANVPSWGSFDIDVTIFWTEKTGQQIPFSVNHDLVFEPQGAKNTFKIKFDRTKLDPLLGTAKK